MEVKTLANSVNLEKDYLLSHGITIMEPRRQNENALSLQITAIWPRPFWHDTPVLSLEKVPDLQVTMEYAHRVDRLASQNFRIAKIGIKSVR
jgi:hypothetical protein